MPESTPLNVHFKAPTDDYVKMFEQMEQDGVISTRGLKKDAVKYGELVFDVNSAYFYNHGGYEFAKQFYTDAYKAAVEIVGGEQYILSAVMHADERNRAMSEALGEDVYHYHLHVVYIPVSADECRTLKNYAVSSFAEKSEKLKYKQKFEKAEKSAKIWKDRYEKLDKDHEELKQKVQPFLDALEIASEKVRSFINSILARGKELYEHKHPARKRGQDMEI